MFCEKKTEVCTFIYAPVCAYFCDSNNKNDCKSQTFGNKCSSCGTDVLPDYIIEGDCKEKPTPKPKPNVTYCKDINVLATTCLPVNPVCGFFDSSLVQCIVYPCAQTYNNLCEACLDKNVEYVEEGECKSNIKTKPVKPIEPIIEPIIPHPESEPEPEPEQIHPVKECNDIDYNSSECESNEPICGELSTSCITIRPCFNMKRDFVNICEACKNRDLISITKGTCESNQPPTKRQTYCKDIDLNLISNCGGYNPVCAYHDVLLYPQTYNNFYEACSDEKVVYVEHGECKSTNPHPIELCNGIDYNADVCERTDEVCGELNIQCITTPCQNHQTYSNLCEACKAENLISITEGSCLIDPVDPDITYCKDIDTSLIRCPSYSPVCAHTNNGPITYNNICEACANENTIYVIYEECPILIIDPPPRDISCSEIVNSNCDSNKYSPVCAKGMDSVSGVTFNNECLACSTKFAVSFSWGECENKEETPEPKLTYCKDVDLTLIDCMPYSPVCGYYTPTPLTKYAPVTFNNLCEACLNKDIEYVENGNCDKSPVHPIQQCNLIHLSDPECKKKGVVCAEVEVQCVTTPCYNQFYEFDSLCEACKQTNVVNIKDGKCPKPKPTPKEFDCRKVNLDKCDKKKSNPVCAKRIGAVDGVTFENECVACSTKYADVYTKGACEGDTITETSSSSSSSSASSSFKSNENVVVKPIIERKEKLNKKKP